MRQQRKFRPFFANGMGSCVAGAPDRAEQQKRVRQNKRVQEVWGRYPQYFGTLADKLPTEYRNYVLNGGLMPTKGE